MRAGYVERFGVGRFQSSDEDIPLYTSLPSYSIFICTYRYLEPLLQYLRYCLSNHTQVTRQLLRQQQLIQPLYTYLIVVYPLYQEYVGHGYHF